MKKTKQCLNDTEIYKFRKITYFDMHHFGWRVTTNFRHKNRYREYMILILNIKEWFHAFGILLLFFSFFFSVQLVSNLK